ncbi:recombinase family protein [Clostridium perfringens]|uniref:recombinase family protein n=1 Tax=Clostridium perfringens TaxID=1502 RepID=UPI001A333F2C|nr:recombinase family protein [Clostridium perfringens]MDT9335857.1 recombinase family protein [Clostridium perfringens]MDT9343614.1 recombinase family protein [Clostridium perfringens]MDT9346795.1 recombinase family protein [Clostridium perfringens]MDT9352700.1 recombinase family protein [Clostridium perfringens]WFB43603.1 recombinase family protein [Clostridium perfringens]
MKKVAIYSRKSVLVEGSVSIETQINMCKDYINNKFPNAKFKVFEDEGFSGGNTNRPAFQKMLRMAQLNEIDIVVCYKVDRIARNTLDFLKILELFKENNVELISISEGFDPNTQMGKVMLTLLASFAEMERTNIQQRVKDNLLSIAKKGKWTGGSPPTGFKNGLNGGLEWDKKDMILDTFNMKYEKETNSKILEYIYERYNHRFLDGTLATTLRKPIYVKSSASVSLYLKTKGYIIHGEEDNIHSYLTYTDNDKKYAIVSDIKGLIEPSTWISINKDMDKNICREGNRFSKRFWLTKTIRCKYCGKTFCGQTRTTKTKHYNKYGEEKVYISTHNYYACRNAVSGKFKTCNKIKRIRQEILEGKVSELIYLLKDKDFFNSSYFANKIDNSSKINNINKQIKSIDKTINNLTDKIALLSDEASLIFISKLEELVKEKSILKNNLLELELQELNSNTKKDTSLIYSQVLAFNDDLSVDDKRKIAMNLFKEIIYDYETDSLDVTFM